MPPHRQRACAASGAGSRSHRGEGGRGCRSPAAGAARAALADATVPPELASLGGSHWLLPFSCVDVAAPSPPSCTQVVQALRELRKFEEALNGQFLKNPQGKAVGNHKVGAGRAGQQWGACTRRGCCSRACRHRFLRSPASPAHLPTARLPQQAGPVAHACAAPAPPRRQALTYAHAAAAVRTCAYKLRAPVTPEQLPLVGARGSRAGSMNGLSSVCAALPRAPLPGLVVAAATLCCRC